MAPASHADLSEQELKRGLDHLIKDGVFAQIVGALTSGVLLVGFALELGATNFQIGLLASVPFFAQLAQIPGIVLVERFRKRRTIAVIGAGLARFVLIPIALAAFVAGRDIALAVLLVGIVFHAGLNAVAGCSWNSWVHDLVPTEIRGKFFGRRLFLATAFGMAAGFIGGVFVDAFTDRPLKIGAYAILFLVAAAAGAASIWHLARMPEPAMPAGDQRVDLAALILAPLADLNFRRLILFLTSWNFAVNLAAPFFTVYILNELGYDLSFVIALTLISQVANLLVLQRWGQLSDRFSNKAVLAVCAPVFIVSILAWTFTTLPEPHTFTIPLLILIHILMGLSAAGVSLASGNIGLKLAPRGRATAYLATNSLCNALAAGIAPIFGGYFADDFAARELAIVLRWASDIETVEFVTMKLRHWDFFFGLAFVVGLYSIHRLTLVREEGEVEEKVLIQALLLHGRRTIRNLSSVSGLRLLTTFPFGLAVEAVRRRWTNGYDGNHFQAGDRNRSGRGVKQSDRAHHRIARAVPTPQEGPDFGQEAPPGGHGLETDMVTAFKRHEVRTGDR